MTAFKLNFRFLTRQLYLRVYELKITNYFIIKRYIFSGIIEKFNEVNFVYYNFVEYKYLREMINKNKDLKNFELMHFYRNNIVPFGASKINLKSSQVYRLIRKWFHPVKTLKTVSIFKLVRINRLLKAGQLTGREHKLFIALLFTSRYDCVNMPCLKMGDQGVAQKRLQQNVREKIHNTFLDNKKKH
ncbi:hypothetical protein BpHYR1_024430 [Brachionus plicatilis]|uniref:Uncharacterized protein n=1 Tax=Brachionus plicatilis TaxID=10195 RepID=A0A3M7PMJ8_BRAPC|nr:hypothetical protein BpHYR1_024430 [Brachionus plicatilis]